MSLAVDALHLGGFVIEGLALVCLILVLVGINRDLRR
jgi:hypothetical protein